MHLSSIDMEIQEYFKDTINIIDYVKMSTATFDEKPLTAVDSLVLCQLFYAKLEEVLDGDCVSRIDSRYPVKDFWKNEYAEQVFADGISDSENIALYSAAAGSRRFRNIVVKNVVSELSFDTQAQFAAACFEINSTTDFVCFRGTDGSIVGWKEDFNTSFMTEVPAQRDAVDYLNRFYGPESDNRDRHIYVGGHSKGGNLAFYAAALCHESIKNRIIEIFSLDSPGFRDEVYKHLMSQPGVSQLPVTKIIPHTSVVGLLMQHQQEYEVIRAKAIGIFQHSAYTWQIVDGEFQIHDHVSREGLRLERTIDEWLQNVDDEHREIFINALFGVLVDNDIETVNDLKNIGPKTAASMISSYTDLDHEVRSIVRKVLLNLARASWDQL